MAYKKAKAKSGQRRKQSNSRSGSRTNGRRGKSVKRNSASRPQTVRVVVEQVAAAPAISPPQQVFTKLSKRQF